MENQLLLNKIAQLKDKISSSKRPEEILTFQHQLSILYANYNRLRTIYQERLKTQS